MTHISHEELAHELCDFLGKTVDNLQTIWDDIGIRDDMRQERTQVVYAHLRNLLEQMVKEEKTLKSNLESNVSTFKKDLRTLLNDLLMSDEEEDYKSMTLLQQEKKLRTRVDTLAKEKHERIKSLKKLKNENQSLCDLLSSTPYYIPSGSVPTREQLENLSKHITELKSEKLKRHTIFVETKKEIVDILEDLEMTPDTSFERDVVCEEEESFLLSPENMKALTSLFKELEIKQKKQIVTATDLKEDMVALWDRLDTPKEECDQFNHNFPGYKSSTVKAVKEEISRCEILKLQNIQKFIERVRTELVEWWDKAYISQEQRLLFSPFTDEDNSEELLEIHEREANRMKHYYHENKAMLEKVAKRETMWQDFLEFERRAADPNRFSNRGGGLLQEEKARKKLVNQLPKLEQELYRLVEDWEKQSGKPFIVDGTTFKQHVQDQWDNFNIQKDMEKQQRLQARQKLMKEEMDFGSKPTTPAKRRFIGTTPTVASNKTRKLNDNTKRSGTLKSATMSQPQRPKTATSLTPRLPPGAGTSIRTTRRALAETNLNNNDTTRFSHTTISSGGSTEQGGCNSSISSIPPAASYNDFSKGLNHNSRPFCRSSVLPPKSTGTPRGTGTPRTTRARNAPHIQSHTKVTML